MKKISTVFKKNPDNLALVIDEVDPQNEWVLRGEGVATRKFDGMACAIIGGNLYKRRDVKKGKVVPHDAIACEEKPDSITGHWPHWVLVDPKNMEDQYFIEGMKNLLVSVYGNPMPADRDINELDGTYELCGETISTERFHKNFNPEKVVGHKMIKHGEELITIPDGYLTFTGLQLVLKELDIEGIVFHAHDGRMAKIRKSDYGIKR